MELGAGLDYHDRYVTYEEQEGNRGDNGLAWEAYYESLIVFT